MRYGPYIVIEGPDGTGKTVLANRLVDDLGFGYVHCGPPTELAFDFYTKRARGVIGRAVIDRFHIGSYCYGIAFRNVPDLSEFENWMLEGFLYAHGTLLVYTIIPPEAVDRNLSRGPDSEDAQIYEDPTRRAYLRSLYEAYIARSELPILRYDYTASPFELDRVVKACQQHAEAHERFRPEAEFDVIGNAVSPHFIFVADRPNGFDRLTEQAGERGWSYKTLERARRMFAARTAGVALASGSGRYLYQTIKCAGLRFADFALFNSVQWDGRPASEFMPEAWRAGREVVALGQNASVTLRAAGVEHRVVPHPQYVRRFHYKHFDRYAAALVDSKPWEV